MQYSIKTMLAFICWTAVLLGAVSAVVRLPLAMSSWPPTIVLLFTYVFVTYFLIGAFTDEEANRPFWKGASIASIGFVVVLFLHMPDGPNNKTTFRPLIDLILSNWKELNSWHSFHIANVVEYWSIPVLGFLGGLVSKRFALRSEHPAE